MRTITFRDSVSGQIADVMSDEGRECAQTHALITYLVGSLLNYEEEATPYRPTILLSEDIVSSLRSFPGSEHYAIGELPLSASSGKQFLKECAPLSGADWNLFIERTNDTTMRYGVFSYYRMPTSISLEDANSLNPKGFSVIIRQRHKTTIEILGRKGTHLLIDFSTTRNLKIVDTEAISSFANGCCASIDADKGEAFSRYLAEVLRSALTAGHGTMLVCLGDGGLIGCPELTDAVALAPPLDFRSAFNEFLQSKSAESVVVLQRNERLLCGLTDSDGIVAFDTLGRVVAYRAFYRPQEQHDKLMPKVVGGARRRAFEGTKLLVGKSINSVLFRSQDGDTLYHGAPDAAQ